jgi:hypothetical protein
MRLTRGRFTLAAGMVAALFMGSVAASPAASAEGLLAPSLHYTFGGDGTLGQFGASVGVDASYQCSALDSPALPQLLGSYSSFTIQITEDIAHNGTETITEATRTLTDLNCDGVTRSGAIYLTTTPGMLPLLPGPSAAVVTMKVCDLLGCTASSDVGLVTLS